MNTVETKFRSGNFLVPVTLEFIGDRIFFLFGYNKKLLEEIKRLPGRSYHGYDKENPRRCWSAPLTERVLFTIRYLEGKNPYAIYEKDLTLVESRRPLFKHQLLLLRVAVTRKRCIWAAEMGTGKTLAAIELMEYLLANGICGVNDFLFCGTKGSLASVELELEKWNCLATPELLSYDQLRIRHKTPPYTGYVSKCIIFDESSKLKNLTAQRTQAALEISRLCREKYGEDAYIIEMSGSPAPKSPVDWYAQTEVVCPGYLSEGNVGELQRNLALIATEEAVQGGTFPKLVTWLDDERKCGHRWEENTGHKDDDGNPIVRKKVCGNFQDDLCHDTRKLNLGAHPFLKSRNEVHRLYARMQGLVQIVAKKDCIDLPDKQYRFHKLTPEGKTLRAAELVAAQSPNVVTILTKLRELSDGFLYDDVDTGGVERCPNCLGTRKLKTLVEKDGVLSEIPSDIECSVCDADGNVPTYIRSAVQVDTPKEAQLLLDLEDHEDVGRMVVYAAFQGSIDRIVDICRKAQWNVIRADGRGWTAYTPDAITPGLKPVDMLRYFQSRDGKCVFVGHPGAAGMGLTLTASPSIVWWSLPFNGEEYIQACDRIHRPGMDLNRGATLIYYFHLPTDQLVFDNLQNKMDLQAITLGQVISKDAINLALKGGR